jgi:stage III sporulation protein AD
MVLLWKAAGMVVITVILSATIGKKEKDLAVALTVTVCCAVAYLAIETLSDVITFLWEISSIFDYQRPFLQIMLKIVGVAVITEITTLISADAGCSSLEKAMQLLGNATILSLSLPLFDCFVDIVQEILYFI